MVDDLVPIIAILVGGGIVFVPLAGITARFALKPLVEAWARLRESPLNDERARLLERRISLLEDQFQTLERENARLLEAADFQLRLAASEKQPPVSVTSFDD